MLSLIVSTKHVLRIGVVIRVGVVVGVVSSARHSQGVNQKGTHIA